MTRPERGMHLDPGQVPTTLKAPATRVAQAEPGQPPAGERWDWRHPDGGIRVEVSDLGGDGDFAALRVYGPGARITPAAALDLARAVHRVCGLPEPILLERVETAVAGRPIATPVLNAAWKVEISDRHGTVILDCGCTRQGYAPGEVRRFAAVLASYADAAEAEPEPDPAEVEALAEVIAGTEGGSYAVNAPDLIARAVLAAGYERRRP